MICLLCCVFGEEALYTTGRSDEAGVVKGHGKAARNALAGTLEKPRRYAPRNDEVEGLTQCFIFALTKFSPFLSYPSHLASPSHRWSGIYYEHEKADNLKTI
ncbi:MAG: hypothetical protein LBB51_04840 [Zoogloeaceae bacterium]|jgi:hypothetical protein|nr:hypothetical protein [Zoogloeaceae bacterium]